MKPSLGIAVNVLLSVATAGLADECHNICADVGKAMSFKSACSAFRNSLPRPKISRKCQAGFNAAVDLNCYDACVSGGYLQPFVYERRLDEACNGALKETPRVLCHDACVQGYRSGAKDMSASLTKRMAEAAPTVLAALKEDTKGRRQTARNARITAPGSTAVQQTSKAAPTVSAGLKEDTADGQQAVADSKPVEETTRAAPMVLERSKEDSASRQQATKRDNVVAPAATTTFIEETTKQIAATEAETTSPSQRTEADSSGEDVLNTNEQENLENGAAELQQPAELEELEELQEAGEIKEAEGTDEEETRRPAGEMEEFDNEEYAAVDGIDLEATANEDGTNQEDIYTWIEDEQMILLSLPITVDNVEKELTIFRGEEPIDVVLAFCRDNMPGEETCADELLTVVQDRIFPDRAQEEKLS